MFRKYKLHFLVKGKTSKKNKPDQKSLRHRILFFLFERGDLVIILISWTRGGSRNVNRGAGGKLESISRTAYKCAWCGLGER